MTEQKLKTDLDYNALMEVVRRRRSVRKFEKSRAVTRKTLLQIAEAGRWAPSGANTQPWDIIIIDEAEQKKAVFDVFMRQSERLSKHAIGFPHVRKKYLENTVAIFIVVADPRWKICFPQASDDVMRDEYNNNNEKIYLATIGAAVQNIQLAVTAVGLTSAWLSGGGEWTTNAELGELLGYPPPLEAIGTIPVGFPEKDNSYRFRRPPEQVVHWNAYDASKFRSQEFIDYYEQKVRPFAMYRPHENMTDWPDADEKLGKWKDAYQGRADPNPSGKLPRKN